MITYKFIQRAIDIKEIKFIPYHCTYKFNSMFKVKNTMDYFLNKDNSHDVIFLLQLSSVAILFFLIS